jgi:DNA polymerase I-like protein with 3'-5' exonuclease and polymerase domains
MKYICDERDMGEVNEWLQSARYFAWDTETGPRPEYVGTQYEEKAGLDPFLGQIYLILLGDSKQSYVLDTRGGMDLSILGEALANPDVPKIGTSLLFDTKFSITQFGHTPANLIDCQLNEQVLRTGLFTATKEAKTGLVRRETSMGSLVRFYFKEEIDKDKTMRKEFWRTPVGQFSQRQMEYFAGDIQWPLRIYREQRGRLKARGLLTKMHWEGRLIVTLARMELEGIQINTDLWLKLYHETCRELENLEARLDKVLQVSVQPDLFGGQPTRAVKYSSSAQLARQLDRIGVRGFVDKKTNKTLSTESKKVFLIGKLNGSIPGDVADTIIEYRRVLKRRDSYGLNFIEAIHPVTQKIHPNYTQAILVTSRISCSPGLQTIPTVLSDAGVPKYREPFVAGKGYVYSIVDASQIEARIMADMTNDAPAIKVFQENGDIYKHDGEIFYSTKIDKNTSEGKALRNNAKAAWLGLGYGQQKKAFRVFMMINLKRYVSQEESDELFDKFFELHWAMKEEMDYWSGMADPESSDEWLEDEYARKAIHPGQVYEALYERMLLKTRGDEEKAARRTRILLTYPERVRYSRCFGGGIRMYRCDFFGWYNAARNFPVQGGAAQIQKESMVELDEHIRANGIDAALVKTVHDEVIVKVAERDAEAYHEEHQRIMVEVGARYLVQVPMKVNGIISPFWTKD